MTSWKGFESDHGLMNVLSWDFPEGTREYLKYLVIVTGVQTGYEPNVNVECLCSTRCITGTERMQCVGVCACVLACAFGMCQWNGG